MVHRVRDYNKPPADFIDARWDGDRAQALIDKGTHKANASCYRDTTKDTLFSSYAGKCAICERKRGYELQVDHYRPTKTRKLKKKTKYNQPGYYWLAYEWSNLIPLCSKCNVIKSNKFPLLGGNEANRINSHVPIPKTTLENIKSLEWLNNRERPLVIHPELESNPARHFKFLNNGTVKGRTEQGKGTIDALQLNRDDLIDARKDIIQKIVDNVCKYMDAYISDGSVNRLKGSLNVIFGNIILGGEINHAFSLYYNFIYRYFEYYIGSKLPRSIRRKVQDYFEEYKKFKRL